MRILHSKRNSMPLDGFTLSELLIAVAILGIIATFTISKVLVTVEESKKRAVFKETVAALQQAHWDLAQAQGNVSDPTEILSKLNLIKVCPNNANIEGCITYTGSETNESGGVLANGAVVYGLYNQTGSGAEGFIIDWNGNQGPNLDGEDLGYLVRCLDSNKTINSCATLTDRSITGYVGPLGGTSYTPLYASIFQK